MSENGEARPEEGSFEWALATIASTLATGVATRRVRASDFEEAARIFVSAFLDLGHDVVLLPDGIWDLTALADGEGLSFAKAVLNTILDHHNLTLIWEESNG